MRNVSHRYASTVKQNVKKLKKKKNPGNLFLIIYFNKISEIRFCSITTWALFNATLVGKDWSSTCGAGFQICTHCSWYFGLFSCRATQMFNFLHRLLTGLGWNAFYVANLSCLCGVIRINDMLENPATFHPKCFHLWKETSSQSLNKSSKSLFA